MAEDIYKEVIDGPAGTSLRPRGEKDELNSQQRYEDEGGSHCFHVGGGLSAVGFLQLGDQNPDNVQEKEEVHLGRVWVSERNRKRNLFILLHRFDLS